MNEFLKKRISDTRTKPQLANISIDLNAIANAGNSATTGIFGVFEGLAKKADSIKLNNERNRISLEEETLEQEFNKEFLSDPTVYQSEGKYNAMMGAYDGMIKQKKQLAINSKYLSSDDIQKFDLELRKRSGQSIANMQLKRNQAYIKENVDATLWNVEQAKSLWKNLTPGDLEGERRMNDMISSGIRELRDNGFITETDAEKIYMKSIIDVEQDMALRQIQSDISNRRFNSPEDKIRAIEEMAKGFANSDSIKARMEIYQKNSNGLIQNDMSGMLLEAYADKVDGKLEREHYNAESWKDKVEAQKQREIERDRITFENNKLKVRKYIDNVNTALEDNDPFALARVVDGRKFTTEQMLTDNSLSQRYYGKSISELSDMNNGAVGTFVHPKMVGTVKEHVADLKSVGLEGSALAHEAIYPVINELAGKDLVKKQALIKQFGVEFREFNPVVLQKGESNPRYFEVQKNLVQGRGAEVELGVLNSHWLNNDKQPNGRYLTLLRYAGGNTPESKQALDEYLLGAVKNSKNLLMLEYMKTSPSLAVNEFLKQEDYFEIMLSDMHKVRELQQGKKYKKANLNKDIIDVQSALKNENVSTIDGEEADVYGF